MSSDQRTVLADELRADRIRPVYVFDGIDHRRIDQVVQFIRNKVIAPGSEAFNAHVVDAESHGWAGILQQSRHLSLFGGRQFVLARYCDRIKTQAKDLGEAALMEYLRVPVESTVLIITGDSFDARRSWVKLSKEMGYHVAFPPPTGKELLTWIRKAAREIGLSLDERGGALLADLVGPDLNALQAEMQKLHLLETSQGRPIDDNSFPDLILEQHQLDAFSLTDCAAPGRGSDMLRNWSQQINQGAFSEEILPLLLTHLRRAIMVFHSLEAGSSQSAIASETGLNSWMLKNKLSPLAGRLGFDSSVRLLECCLNTDAAMKTRPIPATCLVEQLLATIHSL